MSVELVGYITLEYVCRSVELVGYITLEYVCRSEKLVGYITLEYVCRKGNLYIILNTDFLFSFSHISRIEFKSQIRYVCGSTHFSLKLNKKKLFFVDFMKI